MISAASSLVARRSALVVALAAAIVVLAVRIFLLARHSSSLPSWDAWGAEAAPLYTPWLNGNFVWSNLWAWHNEHRIFFTRALDLGLFIANEGQWDVRVQTLASSTLFALMAGMSVYWIRRNVAPILSWVLVSATVLAAVLPCGWANTYQGFQSCFYFVLLFALLTIHAAATSPFSLFRGLLVGLFGLSAVFSLAAGVLVTLSAVAIVSIRVWLERVSWWRAAVFVSPILLVAVWAIFDARKGEIHPATIVDLSRALAIMLSWPFVSYFGVILWIPAVCVLAYVLFRRAATTVDLVFGGMSVWVLLICAAAAWSRAYNFTDVQSRYTDLLIPSFVAQIYFAFRLVELMRRRYSNVLLLRVGAIGLALLSAAGLVHASIGEFWKWREYDFMTRIGATHVRAFLDGDQNALEGKPYGYIPYPRPGELAAVLNDVSVRSYLPISVSSLKAPTPQRSRSCVWKKSNSSDLPVTGSIECDRDHKLLDPTSELTLGRLSAVTYSIWNLVRRQAYTPLVANSPHGNSRTSSAACSIDQVDGIPVLSPVVTVPYADVVRIVGWLGPQPKESGRPLLRLTLDDEAGGLYVAASRGGVPRPEVAEFVGRPGFQLSGFNVILSGASVPSGHYRIGLINETGERCDSALRINVLSDSDDRLSY